MLSIAVCDDEVLDCCKIAGIIKEVLEELDVSFTIRQFYSGKELLQAAGGNETGNRIIKYPRDSQKI